MHKLFFVLFLLGCLKANGSPPLTIYQIDMSVRGQEFNAALATAFATAGSNGEVVIQTLANPPLRGCEFNFGIDQGAPGIVNGIIPYVQNATSSVSPFFTFPQHAPNYTLFVFAYNPTGITGITTTTKFVAVGIEQIVTLAYRNTISPPFSLSFPFTSTYVGNLYPLYYIDPVKRAADIQSVAANFLTHRNTYNGSPSSQLWIWTTLNGNYYDSFASTASYPPGLIPNVTKISILSHSLLLITYEPATPAVHQIQPEPKWSVVVAPEQVQQIIFYPNGPPRSYANIQ